MLDDYILVGVDYCLLIYTWAIFYLHW